MDTKLVIPSFISAEITVFLSGSENVVIDNCKFIDNGESGFKTAQYVKKEVGQILIVAAKNIKISNCYAFGQGYDGFDLQNVLKWRASSHSIKIF